MDKTIEGAGAEGAEGMEGADFLAAEFPDDAEAMPPDITTLQATTYEAMREALAAHGVALSDRTMQDNGYSIIELTDGDDRSSGDELMEPIAAELASHFVQRFFGLDDKQFTQFITLNHAIYENAVLMAEIAIGTFFQQDNRFPNLDNAEDFRALRAIYHPRRDETSRENAQRIVS